MLGTIQPLFIQPSPDLHDQAMRPSFRKSPQAWAPAVQLGGFKLILGQIIGHFKIGETGSLAPVQELADRLIVRDPSILIADRNREEFEEPLGGFRSDIGNDRWNLKRFGFVKNHRTL